MDGQCLKSPENSTKGYILEVNIKYPKNLHDLHSVLSFLQEKMKIATSLYAICMIKKLCYSYKSFKTSIK